ESHCLAFLRFSPGSRRLSLCNFSCPLSGRRKEHDATVESGDTGGGRASAFTHAAFLAEKRTALRSAPSWDRQIGAAHTGHYPGMQALVPRCSITIAGKIRISAYSSIKPPWI